MDLEKMSKFWDPPYPKEPLPKKFTEDLYRFGKATVGKEDFKGIINNEFNRQFLTDNI